MKAVGGGAGETHQHGFSRRCRHFVFGRIAQHRRTIGIGQNEPRIFRHDLGLHMVRNGKKQSVAMNPVFGPFLIDPKILDTRFDFDNPDGAVIGKGDEIGPPTGSQRHFRHRNKAKARQKPPCPPRDHQSGLGLAAIRRQNEVVGHRQIHVPFAKHGLTEGLMGLAAI